MRTIDIILRLRGQNIPKLERGKSDYYSDFQKDLYNAVRQRAADIVHKGDYFRYDKHLLPSDKKDFNTYVLFREVTLLDIDDNEMLWKQLENEMNRLDFIEVHEENPHHQLIELSALIDNIEDIILINKKK